MANIHSNGFLVTFGMISVAIVGFLLLLQANSSPSDNDLSKYREVLEVHGFRDPQIGSSAFWGCGKDDSPFSSREFHATGANGHHVHGVVCCGFLTKGCTVRIQ